MFASCSPGQAAACRSQMSSPFQRHLEGLDKNHLAAGSRDAKEQATSTLTLQRLEEGRLHAVQALLVFRPSLHSFRPSDAYPACASGQGQLCHRERSWPEKRQHRSWSGRARQEPGRPSEDDSLQIGPLQRIQFVSLQRSRTAIYASSSSASLQWATRSRSPCFSNMSCTIGCRTM